GRAPRRGPSSPLGRSLCLRSVLARVPAPMGAGTQARTRVSGTRERRKGGARSVDDLAGVEVVAGVDRVEERADHLGAGGGEVFREPRRVLDADGVVVRQRGAVVDERLLDRPLDGVVL